MNYNSFSESTPKNSLKMYGLKPIKLVSFALLSLVLFSCSDRAPFGDTNYSFRAMDAPDESNIWIAAQHGFWAHSSNSGETWDTGHIAGFDGEIRDIEAWDENTAIAMGIESPGILWKTTNGGKSWVEVYQLDHPSTFFDNMDFNSSGSGIVIGDPIDGKWTILGTHDYGENWTRWSPQTSYSAHPNEVAFAASGSGLICEDSRITFFTGGGANGMRSTDSRLNRTFQTDTSNTFGIYSATLNHKGDILFVGGDYRFPDATHGNGGVLRLVDGQYNFVEFTDPPRGYRSCIIQLSDQSFVCCGPNGVDYSANGLMWTSLTKEGFHVLASPPNKRELWAAGSNGRVVNLTELLP
ncbi:WD40/YVTN/BNR-like repeat-containing protein [Phaeocystidibacter marisrubri]|uniref:Photosynthesis system II assembly factor Ycf48/Hcf136-like domain-containing protein n=1 Tax=Phaeocystidibacter marisrubri TaxID=1577780 RepID=A0A6L3ZJ23_9FLAO|nr:hypothetical protein [Phaeocystidibacter marisrubri]KAB2817633.1 hypothetical protein F8C82_04315 [Phaeocystidibacter marisrubri]GGH74373.1 oxidoreductase [Phaeocystidibacter marisrubri]